MSGPYNPSMLLQKLGKPGRIAKGSRPPKTLSTHHLAERAVMRGESQPRTGQSRQQASAATSDSSTPAPEEDKETEVATSTGRASSSTSTPLAGPGRAGGEEALREATQGASRGPTLLSCPSEGREEEEGRASGCMTPEEVPARGEEFDTEERKSLKGG